MAKGKEFINSPIINFLESKFIAKRPEEVDIEIDQWRIFFPQLIESEDNEKYPFAGIDLDVFQRKRDLDSNHKSYSPTSGGEVHTLISSWLAVGHENKGDKSYYGVPNKLLKSMQQPRTSYALFYLMRDKNLDNEVDIPTLGYRLHFNDNSMPRGSYFARDEAINAQLRAEFESVN